MKRVEVLGEASGNNFKKWKDGSGVGISEFLVSCNPFYAQGEENAITRALSAFSGNCGV